LVETGDPAKMRLMSEIKVELITGAGRGIGPDGDVGSPTGGSRNLLAG
jgi:hypothetical protein